VGVAGAVEVSVVGALVGEGLAGALVGKGAEHWLGHCRKIGWSGCRRRGWGER